MSQIPTWVKLVGGLGVVLSSRVSGCPRGRSGNSPGLWTTGECRQYAPKSTEE